MVLFLRADNMFVTYRVPVKEHLKQGENELVLSFHSTFLKGKELESQHGKFALWNGDSSRLHVRKAQYKSVCSSSRFDGSPLMTSSRNQLWLGLGKFQ
jgi:hypothetical protein